MLAFPLPGPNPLTAARKRGQVLGRISSEFSLPLLERHQGCLNLNKISHQFGCRLTLSPRTRGAGFGHCLTSPMESAFPSRDAWGAGARPAPVALEVGPAYTLRSREEAVQGQQELVPWTESACCWPPGLGGVGESQCTSH